tara:strand:+ start:101 stop:814 length:714 start_codon:yes stop_codon:yes gene_type:complete
MIPSWMSPNRNSVKPVEGIHAILGTPICANLKTGQEESIFACGCFWGTEKGFWKLPGVVTTAVGYAGGYVDEPNYQQVCAGKTGHTEVVRVVWETSLIDFSDLLKLFWECHDPTQGDRQGNDSGSQYRSAIYTTTNRQITLAKASLNCYQSILQKKGYGPITTEIKSNQTFHYAEQYHQQYLAKPGSRPYCSAMPTKAILGQFEGSNYLLPTSVWQSYDWNISHCVLRSSNDPVILA